MERITPEQLLAAFKAVDDEPEFTELENDRMWRELEDCSKEELIIAFKMCVKKTKMGISNRIKNCLFPKPPTKK